MPDEQHHQAVTYRDLRVMRAIATTFTIAWSAWALIGGIYFLGIHPPDRDVDWIVLDRQVYGIHVAGAALLCCGIISLIAAALHAPFLKKLAALLCCIWCAGAAAIVWFATPEFDQGDVESWLLVMCSFTCFMHYLIQVMARE
jgi:hypothetical protein